MPREAVEVEQWRRSDADRAADWRVWKPACVNKHVGVPKPGAAGSGDVKVIIRVVCSIVLFVFCSGSRCLEDLI